MVLEPSSYFLTILIMKSLKNIAIGLTTVATLGTATVAAAAQPIEPNEERVAQIQEIREAVQAGDHERVQELREQYGLENVQRRPERRHRVSRLDAETREAVKAALSAGDYDAFVAAVGEDKADKLTEERFRHMAAVYQAREAGDNERLEELREERRAEREERRAAVREALANGDYDTFVAAHGHLPEELTEEKFTQLAEVYRLKEAGDLEEAKELAQEYGLKRPKHMKRALKHRFRGGPGGGEVTPQNE